MRGLLFLSAFFLFSSSVISQSKIYKFDLSLIESRGATLADGLKSFDHEIQLRAAQQAATWGKAEHIQDLIFLLFNLRNSITLPKHYETMAAAAYALGQMEGSNVQQIEALQIQKECKVLQSIFLLYGEYVQWHFLQFDIHLM